jgi:hypothetical protein
MNRLNLIVAGLTLALLAVCSQPGEASDKNKRKSYAPDTYPACSNQASSTSCSAAEEQVVQELVKILNETNSPQTLLATTLALMPMGKKAQSAVPAIIRNAERLKVFIPLKDMNSAKAENANIILTAMMAIQMDMPVTKEMLGFPGSPFGPERVVPQVAFPQGPACPAYGTFGPPSTCPVPPAGAPYCPVPFGAPGLPCPSRGEPVPPPSMTPTTD